MLIGEKLKLLRRDCKMSQAKFGQLVGMSQQQIAQYENGKRKPKYYTLANILQSAWDVVVSEKIRNSLDVSVFELYRDTFINESDNYIEPKLFAMRYIFHNQQKYWLVESYTKSGFTVYANLNQEGQNKVQDFASDLEQIPKYQAAPPDPADQ